MNNQLEGSIHVAGVVDAEEAEHLIDCRVDCLGFSLVLRYHKEDLGIAEMAAIVSTYGSRCRFLLITYLLEAAGIIDLCRTFGVGMVQLHGDRDTIQEFN